MKRFFFILSMMCAAPAFAAAPSGTVISGGPGSGAVVNGRIDVFGDGVTDKTAAVNAAHTLAAASKFVVALHGVVVVSGPITYKAPMQGDSMAQTVLLTKENSGRAVISIPAVEYWDLRDFRIDAYTGALQNFVGVYAHQSAGAGNHWFMSNVRVRKGALGYDILGWIGDAQNVIAHFCTLGAKLDTLNATRLNLVLEGNTTGLSLVNSAGVQVIGGVIENNTLGVQTANNDGVNFATYWEANGTHARIGYLPGSAQTDKNIVFSSGNMVSSLSGGLVLDNVAGGSIGKGFHLDSTILRKTSSCQDFDTAGYTAVRDGRGLPVDLFRDEGTPDNTDILNLFPNPKFIGGLRGWKTFAGAQVLGSTTVVLETGKTLYGNAVRVTGAAGSTYPHVVFTLPDPITNYLKGRAVTVLAKVYVPTTSAYVHTYDNGATNPAGKADVTILASGPSAVESAAGTSYFGAGAWNSMWATLTVPADATGVSINVYANRSSTGLSEDSYVIVGEIVLFEGLSQFQRATQGYHIHPLAGRYQGLNWVSLDTAIPNTSTQTYSIGDMVWNMTPTKSGTYNPALFAWVRMTNGATNNLGTDWFALYASTVDADQRTPSYLSVSTSSSAAGSFYGYTVKNTDTTSPAEACIAALTSSGSSGLSICQAANATGPTWSVGQWDTFLRSRNSNSWMHFGAGGSTTRQMSLSPTGALSLQSGGSANHAICWKSDGKTLGYCSAVVAADGTCGTCN